MCHERQYKSIADDRGMNMESGIAELVGRLRGNPIYSLSLGSRELFHSNLLGWMFEKYPHTISILAGPVAPSWIEVEREKNNLDLLIRFAEADLRRAIAVEVKVKDAPRLEQLREYDEKIKKEQEAGGLLEYSVRKVLLSLVEVPDEVKNTGSWQFLRLAEIGQRIMGFVATGCFEKDDEVIIRKYAQLCLDLGGLVTKASQIDKRARIYFFERPGMASCTREIDMALRDLRFDDTMKKQRASELRQEIDKRAVSVELSGIHFRTYSGLSNKTPYVGAALIVKLPAPRAEEIILDVSIQGEQYRRVLSFDGFSVASRKEGKNSGIIKAFVEATDGWRWLFGEFSRDGCFTNPCGQKGFFERLNDIPTSQRASKLLCSYAPKYIYQYTRVGCGGAVPADRVVDAVMADLQYAALLLRDPKYVQRFEDWSAKQ